MERSTEVLKHGTRVSCSASWRVGEKVVRMCMMHLRYVFWRVLGWSLAPLAFEATCCSSHRFKGGSESVMVLLSARIVPRKSRGCCPPQSGAGE